MLGVPFCDVSIKQKTESHHQQLAIDKNPSESQNGNKTGWFQQIIENFGNRTLPLQGPHD